MKCFWAVIDSLAHLDLASVIPWYPLCGHVIVVHESMASDVRCVLVVVVGGADAKYGTIWNADVACEHKSFLPVAPFLTAVLHHCLFVTHRTTSSCPLVNTL